MRSSLDNLDGESAGTGISRPLSDNVNLLGSLLGQVIRDRAGDAMLQRVEELRGLCKEAAATDDDAPRKHAAKLIRELPNDDIDWLLRAYGTFFHLVNQAEKAEILRINRARSQPVDRDHPSSAGPVGALSSDAAKAGLTAAPSATRRVRPESIEDAVGRLAREGRSLDDVLAVIGRLDIQPTLTAHPTEARRPSVLYGQKRIAELLADLRRRDATAAEMDDAVDQLKGQIALLLGTDDVRDERPTVDDEVEHGLYFVQGAIWETAPRIHRDVRRALRLHYEASPAVPVFLRWRSWIGSDRDGNPGVTPEVTRRTVDRQRRLAINLQRAELVELHRELSLSSRRVAVPELLLDALDEPVVAGGETATAARSDRAHEPYRLMIEGMIAKLDAVLSDNVMVAPAAAYDARRFVADLDVMHASLEQTGMATIANAGRLARVRVLARTFGFHLAALDVRQHSGRHEQALADLLRTAGVTDDYCALSESGKVALIEEELRSGRPLNVADADLGDETRSVLDTFAVIREALDRDSAAMGSYIISMTHSVSDLLEPMLLARQAGLWHFTGDRVESALDFVPLFETIEDLRQAGARLEAAFTQPIYKAHLQARGSFQEIMLGYSDSNKDGGYWMANWALHRAQSDIGDICRGAGIDFRLFHGRGGTVGRGGGRANQAIGAMPDSAQNGRIRVTEQGEVISFRYALPGIAHRHTEQLVSAMLLTTRPDSDAKRSANVGSDKAPRQDAAELMDRIARESMLAYRALIDSDDFWGWYLRATPVEQISGLPIGSRPASRGSDSGVDFRGLRAIPWVFAWTQTRSIVPGWYGIGTALENALADSAVAVRLRELYDEWPFLRAVIANAEREMARARLPIAGEYALLTDPAEEGATIFGLIEADYRSARAALLQITGRPDLLADHPVIQKSIALRNPYTDVLNLLQIELLRRQRAAGPHDGQLKRLLFQSINGIASAMQSTG